MPLPRASRAYAPLVDAAATRYGIPATLIYAVMAQESNFHPTAFRAEPKLQDGSSGLMQLLLRTARTLGYGGELGEAGALTGLFDPATNIDLGAKLLAANLKVTGSLAGAISAYNGGYRPYLGFGKPADRPLSICLARDQVSGECITHREVAVGEFANKTYVAAVLARMDAYAAATLA